MFLEALVLGTAAGWIRGGSLKTLRTSQIRMSGFLVLAFVLQALLVFMMMTASPFFTNHRMLLLAFSYGFLFIGLFFNLRHKAVWLLVLGCLLNFSVFFLNDGSLPVSMEALETAGFETRATLIEEERLVYYQPAEEVAGWQAFLGKRLTPPGWYPVQQVFSIGDLLVALGIFAWSQSLLLGSQYQRARLVRIDHKGNILK